MVALLPDETQVPALLITVAFATNGAPNSSAAAAATTAALFGFPRAAPSSETATQVPRASLHIER
jgi:hypothetical protein